VGQYARCGSAGLTFAGEGQEQDAGKIQFELDRGMGNCVFGSPVAAPTAAGGIDR